MAEHEKKGHPKQEKVDRNQRVRQNESHPSFDQSHTPDQGLVSPTDTSFYPRMDEHSAILSGMPFSAQRHAFIMRLHQTYGNKYVQRLLASIKAQAKLTVSSPNDACEQEADRVAESVTRTISSQALRQPEEEEEVMTSLIPQAQRQMAVEEEEVQTQPDGFQPAIVSEDLESRINQARGGGQALSEVVRGPMEQAFGADLSGVRVHTDSEADTLNKHLGARAFTTQQDVFFRQGEYSPASGSGQKLIAHELTHVIQQTGGNVRTQSASSTLRRNSATIQRVLSPLQYTMLGTTGAEFGSFSAEDRRRIEALVNTGRLFAAHELVDQARARTGGVPVLPGEQKANVRPPLPPPVYREVSFNHKEIPADGAATSQATIQTIPPNRAATWGFDGNAYGCTISPTGVVTAGKGIAGQEQVQVRVKATDKQSPAVSGTGSFTLMDSNFYQGMQDYNAFTSHNYQFPNFQTGINGLFDMEYQPKNKLASVSLKVKFDIKDDPLTNDTDFDKLQRKSDYPHYRGLFRSIITDNWSKRYQFRNVREPKSVWNKLNPVSLQVQVQEVNAAEHFLIKLDLTQEKGASVGHKDGNRYANLFKGSLQEKQSHFQEQVQRGEDDRIKAISPGTSPGSPAIEFAAGSKDLKQNDKSRLSFMATYLRGINIPRFDITVEGHSAGSDESSLTRRVFGGLVGAKNIISQQRAAEVETYIKGEGGIGAHKMVTRDAGRTGAGKVVIKPKIQAKFDNAYITTAHETGHMFGLADEYPAKTAYGHKALVTRAFGLKYADALVSPPLDTGGTGRFADVMSNGRDVRVHNYVTFWEALCQTTTQKAAVPAVKFGEADWKFVGY
jgi:outer membrane protein OmpA-like peptidoglycan-associated protein